MPPNFNKLVWLIITLTLMNGCVRVKQADEQTLSNVGGWQGQYDKLRQFSHWQVKGRLAYKRGTEGMSASVRWQEAPENTSLKLSNDLGVSLLQLSISPQIAQLEADGKTFTDSNAQQLLFDTSGLDIPIAQLRQWIKAQPSEQDSFTLNEQGFLATLTPTCLSCRRWQISYHSYAEFDGLILPTSLTLRDQTQANAFIKLKVTSWQ